MANANLQISLSEMPPTLLECATTLNACKRLGLIALHALAHARASKPPLGLIIEFDEVDLAALKLAQVLATALDAAI